LQVLGLDATTPLEPRVPLKEFGLDSLMAVELCNSLTRSGGQALSATLLFDYPTLDVLTTYLARGWRLEGKAADASGVVMADSSGSLIADLSDDDAEALLMKELEVGGTEGRARWTCTLPPGRSSRRSSALFSKYANSALSSQRRKGRGANL